MVIGQEPLVADPVEARANVALKDPFSGTPLAEQIETSLRRIGGGSFWSEPVGGSVPRRLGHRTERQQVEGLHRSVQHARDT
jgi:hypothetical protein